MSENAVEDAIHASAYNTPHSVSQAGCRLTFHRENAVDTSTAASKWPGFQGPTATLEEPVQYQLDRDYSNVDYETTSILPSIEQQPGSSWNYTCGHDPSNVYSSQACPRSYPMDNHTVLQTYLQPNQRTYQPLAFSTHAPGQFIRHPNIWHRRTSIELLQNLRLSDQTPQSHFGGDLVPSYTPTIASSSPYSTHFDFSVNPSAEPVDHGDGLNDDGTSIGGRGEDDEDVNSEPYARLICRALKSAPEHKMVLREIYKWFEKNTDKAKKEPNSTGWQNSIRHNLSMNGAFRKDDRPRSAEESKKGCVWVLEPSALRDGVKSTTRYRKTNSNKKAGKLEHPAPQRQRSGAKGGKAAKKAARQRRNARRVDYKGSRHAPENAFGASSHITDPDRDEFLTMTPMNQTNVQPYYNGVFGLSPPPSFTAPRHYGFEDVIGCSHGPPGDSLYYDDVDSPGESTLPGITHQDCGDTFLTGLSCIS